MIILTIISSSVIHAQKENNSKIKIISTKDAPSAIGPYSQAVRYGDFLFLSGQISIDPVTSSVVGDNIESQTEQIFRNIRAVLAEENLSLRNVVKCTVFMKNLDDFARMNAIYAAEFGDHKPARSTVQAARIPKDVLIEIECIAADGEKE
ncbi:MAG: deaminase [Ignavibacteriae bacterium HGW-Ignavibacteriae-3]|nr:MAG: deaminase [Ignavibacteriae bacterium HGW-Ignavibacteriae-3]